jgi:hypothetical protein
MTQTRSAAAAGGEIEKVRAVLTTARRLTAEGRSVDLSAVEGRIRALCRTVEALPRAESKPLAAALDGLLAEFDALAEELTARFAGLPALGELATAKDAAGAYGKTTKHFP